MKNKSTRKQRRNESGGKTNNNIIAKLQLIYDEYRTNKCTTNKCTFTFNAKQRQDKKRGIYANTQDERQLRTMTEEELRTRNRCGLNTWQLRS